MTPGITIREVADRTPEFIDGLCGLWRRSVEATHTFLSPAEIDAIAPFVPQALNGVERLFVAESPTCEPLGFMGVEGTRQELLVLDPASRGRGIGGALLRHGIEHLGVEELTVNEQNPQAVTSTSRAIPIPCSTCGLTTRSQVLARDNPWFSSVISEMHTALSLLTIWPKCKLGFHHDFSLSGKVCRVESSSVPALLLQGIRRHFAGAPKTRVKSDSAIKRTCQRVENLGETRSCPFEYVPTGRKLRRISIPAGAASAARCFGTASSTLALKSSR